MSNQLLTVKASCRDNEKCFFEDKDVFLDISIINKHDKPIGFPLEYAKERSPIIRLIDRETKKETNLPTHIADWDLKEKFTQIYPNRSVNLEWVITSDELKQFGGDYVDVLVEITIMVDIQVDGKVVEFKGSDRLRIVSKEKVQRPSA